MGLTLAIPTFNRSAQLNRLILEIAPLFQRSTCPTKLVIVDDGSTDSTSELLSKLQKRFGWIEVHSHKNNLGYANSFLDCLEFANDEWVMLLEDDGIIDKEQIEKVCRVVQFSDSDILVTDFQDMNGNFIRANSYEVQRHVKSWENLRHAPGILYRSEALLRGVGITRKLVARGNVFAEIYPQICIAIESLHLNRVLWSTAMPCRGGVELPTGIGGAVPYFHPSSRAVQSFHLLGVIKEWRRVKPETRELLIAMGKAFSLSALKQNVLCLFKAYDVSRIGLLKSTVLALAVHLYMKSLV